MNGFWLYACGILLCAGSMTALFRYARRQQNYAWVDVLWSGNFVLLALLWGLLGSGYEPRRWLVAGMYALWGGRLALYLGGRVAGHAEEGRYRDLRQRWGATGEAALQRRMYQFYLLQGALNVVLALPLWLAVNDAQPSLRALEWAAAALWLVALGGESLADRQLAAFKAVTAQRERVCEHGLWRFSRHPNYFFEWLVWVAYALAACESPFGLIAFAMPALMLYFLLRVTGIPATEAQLLRSKGAAYADYQRRVSPFLPLPPRRTPT